MFLNQWRRGFSLHNCRPQILAAKQKDPNADTSALERQIDQMVYNLYGLTEDEIKIVENSSKK
jgi:hypothetical protein